MKDTLSFHEDGQNGDGVLLVHGLTGAPSEMRLIARRFQRLGYSVSAPLLAGHGSDSKALRRTNWRDWLDTVAEAADRAAQRVDRLHAAGICMGGSLALLASTKDSCPIRSVALYSPCFTYDGWGISRTNAFLARRARIVRHIPFFRRIRFAESESLGIKDARLRARLAGLPSSGLLDFFPAHGLIEMADMAAEMRRMLPQVKTPTIIIHALEDEVSHPDQARYIARNLGGPKELHLLSESYHMIHVDSEHKKVADLSARFFEAHHAH